MIASKYFENDPNIPFYKEFQQCSRRAVFSKQKYIDTETHIISHILKWDLYGRITTLQVVDNMVGQGVLFQDDEINPQMKSVSQQAEVLGKKCELFSDLSIDCIQVK